jgi:hypothetical protein
MRKLSTPRSIHYYLIAQDRLTPSADKLRWNLGDHISAVRSVSQRTLMGLRTIDSHGPHSREHLVLIPDDY